MTMISLLDSRRRLRNRPGQSLVEFVLVAPLLLLLFFGLVEFARAWNIRHVITDAAREGARILAVDNGISPDSVEVLVGNALGAAGLVPASATITLVQCEGPDCPDPDTHTPNMSARASISYPYQLRLVDVFLGWALPDPVLDINTTFVMRNE